MQVKITDKHTVFSLILTAAAAVSLFFPLPLAVKMALALGYFLSAGHLAGMRLLADEHPVWRTFFGFLATVSTLAVVGGAVYYFHKLDAPAVALLLFAPVLLPLVPIRKRPDFRQLISAAFPGREDDPEPEPAAARPLLATAGLAILAAAAIGLIAYGFAILGSSTTDMSIRSPWDMIPRMFFIVFFLAALATFCLALGGAGIFALPVMAGLALLAVSVAAIVYRVGFGFDPFIHQATESVIFRLGEITPKPLYYLGQYSLVTVIARLLGGHVLEIDRWLVPVAATLVLPCAYYALRRTSEWRPGIAAASTFALLLLPLSSFVATTPQGLANAFTLMTAFLALPVAAKKGMTPALPILLALAAAAIHPLAGIPLLFFAAILILMTATGKGRRHHEIGQALVVGEIALIGAVALPAVFLLNAAISHTEVTFNAALLADPAAIIEGLRPEGVISRRFMAAFDIVYFWRSVREIAIVLAGLLGAALLVRKMRPAAAYVIGFLIFGANYVLLKTVLQFSFLIDYERSSYADRLLELMLLLLAPPAVYAFGLLLHRMSRGVPALRLGAALMAAALATSSLYLAYPRRDLYDSSRGWSTSAADVKAVRLINKDAAGRDYVVLAPQSVSAAAIREFGFKKYYGGLFYYPIPTGDRLYKEFLDMNESQGKASAAQETMDLTGTDTVYFVVTNYWWHAQRIIVAAKREADEWWNVDDTDFVFKYVRPKLRACDPTKPGSCG